MTRLHSGSVTRPRFETRPYKPSAATRKHFHGDLVPMHQERMCGLQWVSTIGSLTLVALIVAFFAGQMIRGAM